MSRIKIRIEKIKELENAYFPNNIPEGYVREMEMDEMFFRMPTIGHPFIVGCFITSSIQKVIDSNTFETMNSIYKWSKEEVEK